MRPNAEKLFHEIHAIVEEARMTGVPVDPQEAANELLVRLGGNGFTADEVARLLFERCKYVGAAVVMTSRLDKQQIQP
jgi:hypothetical protein